jgi:very-short-patch-repair endonuclease
VNEPALFELASRQYGLIERKQALRLGVDDDALRRRVSAGLLQRDHPGVYRFSAAPRSWDQRLLAACLAAGPGSAISHRAAAHEWNLAEFPDVVEIVTSRSQWPRLKAVRVHRSKDLRPEHLTTRRRIPITKPLRTLIDLGQSAPWAVADALELGLANRLFGIKAADAALDEFSCRGRTGVGVFRRVIDDRALERGIPDGLLEPRMARLMRNHGLPVAAFQHWVTPDIRVDFAYPDQMIVIEVDGFSTRRTPGVLDAGNARQNELVLRGWTVLRFSWKQVVRQPDVVAKTVLVTLTRAQHESA